MNKFLSKFVVGAFALAFSVPNANAQTQLFTNGTNPTTYYRIPSIVRLKNGCLWAFSDKRFDSNGDLGDVTVNKQTVKHRIDVVGRIGTLKDNAYTWADQTTILAGDANATEEYKYAYGDAATVVDRESGNVLMMAAAGKEGVGSSVVGHPLVSRSIFNGSAWATSNVTSQFYGQSNAYGTHLFVSSGRMVQSTIYKKDKFYRIYAGICLFSKNASYVAYSDDFGATWHYLGGDQTVPVQDGDECKVEELPNGDILLVTRKRSGKAGRYVNVFKFSDIANGAGSWQTSVSTGASQTSGEAYAQASNGEILLVPAKDKAGKQTYVLLLSVPIGDGRSNVCIYWKELPDVYSNPANYVGGWNKYQVNSGNYKGYTTMVLDQKGDVAFLSEMSAWVGPLSFISLPLSTITSGAYSYSPSASGTYHTTSEPNSEHGVGGIKKPAMSVAGGTYANSQTITLTAPDGAQIYYTLDGSEPQVPTTTTGSGVAPLRAGTTTTGTQLYSTPITLSEGTTTLKALAVDNNGNKSQTVTSTYTIMGSKSKTGTTITLDYKSSNALYTSGGFGYDNFAFLRHNSSHIQLMSSTSADIKEGEQLFSDCENNMEWSKNDTPDPMLILHNGRSENKWSQKTQYGHYAIIAPKGYRFLRYEIVMTSGSQQGGKLEEYTYKNGSTSEIELVGPTASATASATGDVTLSRTLDRGTNVLYFRQDALAAGTTQTIKVKSIKLVYAIDQAFDETFPNQNGTAFSSGFVDFGPTSQPDPKRNYGFVNANAHDKEMVNVKNVTDGTTPQEVTVDGSKYFMATTDGDYYLEAPKKFRIVGATVNLKYGAVVSEKYTPSTSSNGDQIVMKSPYGENYLKIDNGSGVNTSNRAEATIFNISYDQSNSGYTIMTPDNKYLYIVNATPALKTSDSPQYWTTVVNKSGKTVFCFKRDGSTKRYLIYADNKNAWGDSWDPNNTAAADAMTAAQADASTFNATVYGPDGNTPVTDEKTLDATSSSASVTVDNLNNDAVRVNLAGIQSGGTALFNVQLKLIALNPEAQTVEAAASFNDKIQGNSPVTSENYVFNHGNVINVPVQQGTTTATMVFCNAHNEELTNWYTNGTNTNGADVTGSYSNLYLIGGQADQAEAAWSTKTPYPGARTDVDQIGTVQIPATNIATLVAEKDKTGNKETLTLQDNTVNASSAKYQTVTMNVGDTSEPTEYYLYSADRPTNNIMPSGYSVGDHIDFRFYSIKVKPVEAEKPKITIVPLYTSTMKGQQHKKTTIASDGNTLNTKDKYVGIKVEAQLNDGVTGSVAGYLTAEAIEDAMKTALNSSAYKSPHEGDPLRNVLYVDMSSLTTVTTANSTTMADYAKATADNCLFFVPKGFAATNMANSIAKQSDGTYQAIGDVTVYDQQPFFTPYDFTTGQFKAVYEREGTVNGESTKALVRNMAAVLPFDIQLDGAGHPYLDGKDEANKHITFKTITDFGELTAVRKDSNGAPLTYGVKATDVTDRVASANKPYYVALDDKQEPGFSFNIPGASFAKSGTVTTTDGETVVTPDELSSTYNDWTSHGTYSGVQPDAVNGLWYFSKDLFWNSGLLKNYKKVNVRPFRAYYNGSKSNSAKAAVVYDDSDIVATGITTINGVSTANGKVYDLNGRYVGDSLDNLAPGLYIQNGRKVVKQ